MFTGLIESVGTVTGLAPVASGFRLCVGTPLAAELSLGESLSINGVCLTVTAAEGGDLHADIGPETARVTTLGALRLGDRVNLERAMRADTRMGGHFVQGHVDGAGTIREIRQEGDACWLTISLDPSMLPWVVGKGSIAVDGISLTVAALGAGTFDVMIIPFTWAHTNLSTRRVGDRVNLECDMIGKYVARAFEIFEKERQRI